VTPLLALAAALLAGAAPFTAEQPRVREGNEKLLSGDPAGALERYDAAEREAGRRPEIDFDRGDALYAQGRHAEAREAWKKAVEADQAGALSSRALQNMGNALDAAGDHQGAARAFSEALTRDPANDDARYNLEVLLRRKAAGQGKPKEEGDDGARKQQGPPQGGQGQQPKEEQQPKGAPGQQQPGAEQRKPEPGQDERRRAGEQERREQGQQEQPGAAGQPKAGDDGRRAGVRPEGLARQDAERLLDALRARERNMPLGPAGRKEPRRRDAGKDW
jgi:Ca-activated chloride channel family protein